MRVMWKREVDPAGVVVSPRPVWKCRFCENYGRNPSCPPHAPSWQETRELLKHYSRAILIKFEVDRENFDEDKREVLRYLLDMEREEFRRHPHALALFPGACNLCAECTFPDRGCSFPQKVRPSINAVGIELTSITRLNFEESVLYGMLLLD